jgi:glycosyltransferase involved in cell wall biosynthesis
MDDVKRRVLWVWGKPKSLNQPPNQAVLEKYMPSIVFTGSAHLKSWKSWRDFTNVAITPGVGDVYRDPPDQDLSPHPTAVITTHPRHGLQKIIRMWRDRIYPVDVSAELHIYSAGLYRALDGGDLAEGLRPILEDVKDAKSSGVIVKRPVADAEMAKAYGQARAHLYPQIENEMYGSTLAESQAAGLPAIVKSAAKGIDPVTERIHNGQTGYLAPDDEAFTNLTIDLLDQNSTMYDNLSRDARTLQSTRSWDAAAIEFEALWK